MATADEKPLRGRGAAGNPRGRFERLEVILEEPAPDRIPTRFLRDESRSALSFNTSPDVPFEVSLNPYRGCEHGCAYCYARPTHEYLGFSPGLDFESRILVKEQAPELLARTLASRRWRPRIIALSGVTDPYQPVERRLGLTRSCLEVLEEHRNPVSVVTKNHLVTRDLDLLGALADREAASVALSITTLDAGLARTLEPRTSHPRDRLQALARCAERGVPCGVMVAPVIPGLTEHEIPEILSRAAEVGAGFAQYLVLRLPGAVEEIFLRWLRDHRPSKAGKIVSRLRQMRRGRLSDARFGSRMRGEGIFAEQIASLFHAARRRSGLSDRGPELSVASFRRQVGPQTSLFDPPSESPQ